MADIQLEQVLPTEIERRSFELIQQELDEMKVALEPEHELVIKRAIHTTADFDYARSLVFSSQAVKKGIEALKNGGVIITDTNMGKSGINKKAVSGLGGEVVCFMADEDVALNAAAKGTTRAVASMEKAARLFGGQGQGTTSQPGPSGQQGPAGQPGPTVHVPETPAPGPRPCIFAIGNAPTALVRLYELIQAKEIRPALVIGAPVGFVNVVQSKELILTLEDTPFIVARGRKGGSNVAAAICNALLYQMI